MTEVHEMMLPNMAAIMPFRHLIVYPPLMREIGRDWRASAGAGQGVAT